MGASLLPCVVLLSMISAAHCRAQLWPQIQLSADAVLVDEKVAIVVSALAPGQPAASTTLRRRFVQEGVRRTPVRENGLVASFYEPPQAGPHPALMILSGSGGGIPERAAQLLASHGYAALAVEHFGMAGLPATLSLNPLEYFGRAFEWLQAQRAVDGTKIGILRGSRGGELAFLLGATYPQITTVVAYAPSHVV
jgi:hypothetical protein